MLKILGVDIGKRYVGLAISDERGVVALPLGTVELTPCGDDFACAKYVARKISAAAHRESADKIVLGLPLLLSGEDSPMTRFVRTVAENLERMGYEVSFQDERFTSVEAEKYVRATGKKPSRDKHRVNQTAAVLILQTYLDICRGGVGPDGQMEE